MTVDAAGGLFEHFNGVALQGDNLRLDNTARVRLRKQALCTPPLSYLVDCWHDEAEDRDVWLDEVSPDRSRPVSSRVAGVE